MDFVELNLLGSDYKQVAVWLLWRRLMTVGVHRIRGIAWRNEQPLSWMEGRWWLQLVISVCKSCYTGSNYFECFSQPQSSTLFKVCKLVQKFLSYRNLNIFINSTKNKLRARSSGRSSPQQIHIAIQSCVVTFTLFRNNTTSTNFEMFHTLRTSN